MKKIIAVIAVIGLGLLVASPALAAFSRTSAGTVTDQFLRLSPSAKAIAMGEAAAAMGGEVADMVYNPATLADINNHAISVMHGQHIQSVFFDYVGYGLKVNPVGTLAIGFQYLNGGKIAELDDQGIASGTTFRPYNLAINIGWARNFKVGRHYLAPGVTMKYVRQSIIAKSNAFALDLGAMFTSANDKLRIGLSIVNISAGARLNTGVSPKEKLPLVFRVATSYRFTKRWQIAGEIDMPRDHTFQLGLGGEYCHPLDKAGNWSLAGRLGYNTINLTGRTPGFAGLRIGLGIGFKTYALDYAATTMGSLGAIHRVSLSARFGKGIGEK